MKVLSYIYNGSSSKTAVIFEDGTTHWYDPASPEVEKLLTHGPGIDLDPPSSPFPNVIELRDNHPFVRGTNVEVPEELYYLIKKVSEARGSTKHLELFLTSLARNPSRRARTLAYTFINHHLAGIASDGRALGFKSVRKDFRDHYTGKFDNSPGRILEMPRHDVDDDPHNTCSYGFHIGSYEYARSFRPESESRILLCAFSAEDIVAVPTDGEKLRVCKYEVLKEVEWKVQDYGTNDTETDETDETDDTDDTFDNEDEDIWSD